MDLDLYDDTYDLFCQLIKKPNATIFEIGCGSGNITKYLLAKRPDFNILATDVAPSMIVLAQQNNPTAKFMVMDARKIDALNSKFNGIMCGFCMPYLSKEDCLKLIKDSSDLLEVDGVFYGSAIEGNYDLSDYETSSDGQVKMFVYYHQTDYLLESFKENNMEVIDLIRKKYQKSDGTTSIHLIIIAKKK